MNETTRTLTVDDLYPRLREYNTTQRFWHFDDTDSIGWDIFPDPPAGWVVRKTDFRTKRYDHTRGGFHAEAVRKTLESWGLPAGAVWCVLPHPPDEPTKESVVYAIGSPASRLVKIGQTEDLQSRLAAIQRMSPVPLAVLWTTPGGAELERKMHRVFASCRKHGEWFDFGDVDAVTTIQKEIGT